LRFAVEDFHQDPGRRGRDFRIHLVRGNFKDGLITLDAVSNLLEPARHRSFSDGFAHLRHDHVYTSHSVILDSWKLNLLPGRDA
jgi:hypothetical protein